MRKKCFEIIRKLSFIIYEPFTLWIALRNAIACFSLNLSIIFGNKGLNGRINRSRYTSIPSTVGRKWRPMRIVGPTRLFERGDDSRSIGLEAGRVVVSPYPNSTTLGKEMAGRARIPLSILLVPIENDSRDETAYTAFNIVKYFERERLRRAV